MFYGFIFCAYTAYIPNAAETAAIIPAITIIAIISQFIMWVFFLSKWIIERKKRIEENTYLAGLMNENESLRETIELLRK